MYYTAEYYATEYYLRSLRPNKGNNMNEINNLPFDPEVTMVEILDSEGNPTGQYRPREAAPEEATIYTTAEDGDHAVDPV